MKPTAETNRGQWLTRQGARPEHGPSLFMDAADFYNHLAREIDEEGARSEFPDEILVGFTESRRAWLHHLLDVALDQVELVGRIERECWP